ncbi:MAG TPA: hypothetical protein PLW50_01085 [Smithellaceae bacterium]|nr:hypothetical protein [Smithellaceae bacterium]
MNLTITQIEDICIYMNWKFSTQDMIVWEIVQGVKGGAAMLRHPLDLNDASLCAEKMVENGDWFEFFKMVDDFLDIDCCGVTAWLFNSQDFFTAMASWLRGKQYTPSIRTR